MKIIDLFLEVALLMGVPPVLDLPSVDVVKELPAVCGTRAKACYIRPRIYMSDSLEEGSYKDSILVHELAHHAQEMLGIGGTEPTCDRWYAREYQAYQVQKEWLEHRSIRLIIPRLKGMCVENP